MKKQINSVFRFEKYIVNKVEFEYNFEFDDQEAVDIDFSMSTNYEINDNQMVTIIDVTIFDDPLKNNYPFRMYMQLAGVFSLQEGCQEDIEKFKPNSVSILFPYIRALVSSFTANANVTPLILPTINVNAFIKETNIE